MNKIKNFATKLWKDESGQGTAEYILLIAIVVGLIMVFRERITGLVKGKIDQISDGFGQINTQ